MDHPSGGFSGLDGTDQQQELLLPPDTFSTPMADTSEEDYDVAGPVILSGSTMATDSPWRAPKSGRQAVIQWHPLPRSQQCTGKSSSGNLFLGPNNVLANPIPPSKDRDAVDAFMQGQADGKTGLCRDGRRWDRLKDSMGGMSTSSPGTATQVVFQIDGHLYDARGVRYQIPMEDSEQSLVVDCGYSTNSRETHPAGTPQHCIRPRHVDGHHHTSFSSPKHRTPPTSSNMDSFPSQHSPDSHSDPHGHTAQSAYSYTPTAVAGSDLHHVVNAPTSGISTWNTHLPGGTSMDAQARRRSSSQMQTGSSGANLNGDATMNRHFSPCSAERMHSGMVVEMRGTGGGFPTKVFTVERSIGTTIQGRQMENVGVSGMRDCNARRTDGRAGGATSVKAVTEGDKQRMMDLRLEAVAAAMAEWGLNDLPPPSHATAAADTSWPSDQTSKCNLPNCSPAAHSAKMSVNRAARPMRQRPEVSAMHQEVTSRPASLPTISNSSGERVVMRRAQSLQTSQEASTQMQDAGLDDLNEDLRVSLDMQLETQLREQLQRMLVGQEGEHALPQIPRSKPGGEKEPKEPCHAVMRATKPVHRPWELADGGNDDIEANINDDLEQQLKLTLCAATTGRRGTLQGGRLQPSRSLGSSPSRAASSPSPGSCLYGDVMSSSNGRQLQGDGGSRLYGTAPGRQQSGKVSASRRNLSCLSSAFKSSSAVNLSSSQNVGGSSTSASRQLQASGSQHMMSNWERLG